MLRIIYCLDDCGVILTQWLLRLLKLVYLSQTSHKHCTCNKSSPVKTGQVVIWRLSQKRGKNRVTNVEQAWLHLRWGFLIGVSVQGCPACSVMFRGEVFPCHAVCLLKHFARWGTEPARQFPHVLITQTWCRYKNQISFEFAPLPFQSSLWIIARHVHQRSK